MKRLGKWGAIILAVAIITIPDANAELRVLDLPEDVPNTNPMSVPAPSDTPAEQPWRPGAENVDVIEFINKDKMHGALISINLKKHGLSWKHRDAKDIMDFSTDNISHIKLAARRGSRPQHQGSTVLLTNDDMLTGSIVSLDEQNLVLNTWYAGKIQIRRAMLKTLNPNAGYSAIVYEGPTDLANWSFGERNNGESWKLKNGALYALQSQPIGKLIENMPDMADIRFDVAWRGYPQFYFAFYTDNLQQYYGNCYLLQVSSSSIYLQRYTRNGSSNRIGNMNFPRFSDHRTTSARFNILVDKNAKSFSLLIDGQIVKQWSDPNAFAGMGKGILFQPQTQGGMKVSNIRISEWGGKIPQQSDDVHKREDDLIRFTNNDKVSGRLQAIQDGKVKFKTSYAVMDVPLERITEIEMSTVGAERARRNKQDVRARFVGKGTITVQLAGMDKGMLEGTSENFGAISLPLYAFHLLEFNVYEDKTGAEDDDDGTSF